MYTTLQITPLQDFGAEKGEGWAHTPNFTVIFMYVCVLGMLYKHMITCFTGVNIAFLFVCLFVCLFVGKVR